MVTAAPACVSAAAMARPMPRPPPVTSACRPSREAIFASCAANTLSLNFLVFKTLRCCGGAHERSCHRWRPGRPLLRHPDEKGVAADAYHRVRAQQAGRYVRLRRGVLRSDAGGLRVL